MDISEIKYEPWKVVRQLGQGSFGAVYEIQREEFGETYRAALKVISIPESDDDIIRNRADGMTNQSMTTYYQSVVQELTHEFALLSKLKGQTNIVGYEDHKVVPHADGIGWDIYIRMELLTSLTDISAVYDLTRDEVVKLGIDICDALTLCSSKSIIHRDIKPDNIFVSDNGDFELGDFGIARTASKTMTNMSRKGTPNYMAPEIFMNQPYNASVDIYSLGIVMYQLMNNKRLPFIPAQLTVADKEAALGKRMSGEAFPAPESADPDLTRVILKACAFQPSDRYFTAEEMKRDLQSLLNGKTVKFQFDPAKIAAGGAQMNGNQNSQYGNQNDPYNQGNAWNNQQGQGYGQNGTMNQNWNGMPNHGYNQNGTMNQNGNWNGMPNQGYNQNGTMNQNWNGVPNQGYGQSGPMNQSGSWNGMPNQGYGPNNSMNQDGPQNGQYINYGNLTQKMGGPSNIGDQIGNQTGNQVTPKDENGGAKKKGTPNMKVIIGAGAAAIIVLLVAVIALASGGKSNKTNSAGTSTAVTTPSTSNTAATPENTDTNTSAEPEQISTTEQGKLTLSDDPSDYTFELEGVVYKLPFAYQEFVDNGWTLYNSQYSSKTVKETDEIAGQKYDSYQMSNGLVRIYVEIFNPSGNVQQLKDCKIGGIDIEARSNLRFTMAKGITCLSTADEVKAAYGLPSNSSSYSDYETLTYEFDSSNNYERTRISIYQGQHRRNKRCNKAESVVK